MTVVIPTYNAARHVDAALASVIAQHRRDVEIVVVDDGSTDGTADRVEALMANLEAGSPRTRLIRQDNAGVSAARNRGIAAAETPLIGFLDADDRWAPTKVARQLRLMETHPDIDLSFTGFRFIDDGGADLTDGFFAPESPLDHTKLLLRNILHTSTVVCRKDAIEDAGGFDETIRHYEDYDLWLRIAMLRPGNILGLRDQLADYRRHGSQATKDWSGMEASWRKVVERAAERDPEGWRRVAALSRGNLLEYCAALAYNAGDPRAARRLMIAAWRAGGIAMIGSHYARSMTLIALASLLPKEAQKPLGAAFLRMKKLRHRIGEMREADRRRSTTAPFNAHDGLWDPHEDTTRKVVYDHVYGLFQPLVPRRRPSSPFVTDPRPLGQDEARELAARCRRILDGNLAPFFLGCADSRHGGYLENADNHGFYDRGDKWLIKQARNLWTFSYMARHGAHEEPARALADQGFAFLQAHFLDREHGGYFDRTTSDGRPLITVKLQRHQAHTISALGEYARLTGFGPARDAALAAFDTLEAHARASRDGGYVDCLRADWSAASPDETRPHQTVDGARHLDAEIHVLEALVILHGVAPEERVRRKMTEQVIRCLNRFRHARVPANLFHHNVITDLPVDALRENMHATYGHDLELIFFVFDALEALGIGRHAAFSWARRLSEHALHHSFDRARGGFFDQGRLSGVHFLTTGRDKIWWVQADAMVSMLEMHRTTGQARFAEAFRRTLGFVERHMLAPAGGWYRTVDGRGRVIMPVRAAANQGPYHMVRSMIRSAALLDAVAAGAPASGPVQPELS